VGFWGRGPPPHPQTPNPQSPIPNPQSPEDYKIIGFKLNIFNYLELDLKKNFINIFFNLKY
jgi:hypothetical protein